LQEVIEQWNAIWQESRPVLRVYDEGAQLRIIDTRPLARQQSWTMGELEACVYRACDSARTPAAVMKDLARLPGDQSSERISSAIETLCDAKVLVGMNGKLLSLGVAV